jgi:hypothetical protein
MPDRQDVEVVSGKKLGFPQGLTDQLRLGRKHYFGDAHLLERFVLLSLIQSRQNDQFISGDQLLQLFFVADRVNSVIGLEHGLGHRRQKLFSAVLPMFLEADDDGAKAVEQLHLRH